MDFRVSLLGFFVGLLVGLTGMGGGALMTPALILLGWARPVIAVGTDLVWGALTKAVGAWVHYRQKTVDFTIVRCLAAGSIPGVATGLVLLAHMQNRRGNAMDRVVVRMLGIALMFVAVGLFAQSMWHPRTKTMGGFLNSRMPTWLTPLVGAVIGFLVSLTSVGSGSLIVACLVVIYPNAPLKRIVGSDILHAIILVGISAVGHLGIGNIDASLLGRLLLGSIPGVWLGSRMTAVFPEKVLRPTLATTLFFLGYKLL